MCHPRGMTNIDIFLVGYTFLVAIAFKSYANIYHLVIHLAEVV